MFHVIRWSMESPAGLCRVVYFSFYIDGRFERSAANASRFIRCAQNGMQICRCLGSQCVNTLWSRWLGLNVLGLQAEADEAGGEVLEAGDAGEDAQCERHRDRAGVVQDAVEDAVSKDLEGLRAMDGLFAVVLDLLQVVRGEGV